MCHQGLNDREVQTEIFKAYHALCPELGYVSPALSPAGTAAERTTVGFISRYFMDHSIGRILVETVYFLVNNHPELDVVVFLIDDSPEGAWGDYVTVGLADILGPDRMRRLPGGVRTIRDALSAFTPVMDVLVFTDVGMDLLTYLLASSRFAYYQV